MIDRFSGITQNGISQHFFLIPSKAISPEGENGLKHTFSFVLIVLMKMNILQQATQEISYMFLHNYVSYNANSIWMYVFLTLYFTCIFATNKTSF